MLPTLRKYADIIQTYKITRFEQAGQSFRLRAQVTLGDGSQLYIRETVIEGTKRKYAYHWQDTNGNLLIRWDNAPDWDVETFPHHKHLGDQKNVAPSYERTLEQVLAAIAKEMAARQAT
jgi:hypothetical protein